MIIIHNELFLFEKIGPGTVMNGAGNAVESYKTNLYRVYHEWTSIVFNFLKIVFKLHIYVI